MLGNQERYALEAAGLCHTLTFLQDGRTTLLPLPVPDDLRVIEGSGCSCRDNNANFSLRAITMCGL
jgi:hypothetical protein